MILSSCQATSFLEENQTFLHKNKIKFITTEKINNKAILSEELYTFLEQVPNENILWVNRQWFHYVLKDKKMNWFNKFVKKSLAQEPVIFDEKKAISTSDNLTNFLRDKRGFYNAEVSYKQYNISKYLTDVEYTIRTGKQYTINSIDIESKDPEIDSILKKHYKNSFFVWGDPVNSTNYDLEKIRITSILQNQGYAAFNQDFIELLGDSSDYKTDLNVVIKDPPNNGRHIKYRIGKVNVLTDFYPTQQIDSLYFTEISGMRFFREKSNFLIDPVQIVNAINLKPGDMYSKEKNGEIYTRLSKFQVYKFISIKTEIDTSESGILDLSILMYVHENKYAYDSGANIKYLRLSSEDNLINTGLNGNIFDRRVTDKGDNILLDASGDIKIYLNDGSFQEVNANAKIEYSYPNTSASIKVTPIILINNVFLNQGYDKLKNNVTSNLSISYNHQNILKKFQISSFNFNYGYNYLSKKDGLRMQFGQAGLNYNKSEISDYDLFKGFQRKSMNDFFQTGLIFKSFLLDLKRNSDNDKILMHTIFGLEISGSEIFLANKLYNQISGYDDNWRFNRKVDYAKFIKASIEFRPNIKTGKTNEIAGRVFAGIGFPFGDSQSLPYIKQFEVGGPTSMRAWTARSLGPGGYYDNNSEQLEYPYQKGDIRLEANIEYRFKLSSYFRSALFLDAGNIWTLKKDAERPDAEFTSEFFRQIALNAGVSLQLDVFLLLRFDFAFKMRHPYRNESGKYWDFNSFRPTFVFSINNPF
ncbi:MAG: hypothetical protein ACM3PT_06975 [Deltaproteobacteria bacterium]